VGFLLPFLPAIIGAGGSIASSALSSRSQRQAEERARNSPEAQAQTRLLNQQATYGRQAGDVAGRLLPTYEEGVSFLSDHWRKLLGEDNAEAFKAIAPLIRARQSQTGALLRSADFMPRGGGRGETYARMYDDEGADILDMLGTERRDARSSYAQLIGDVGARGSGLLQSASGSTGAAASGFSSLLGVTSGAGAAAGQRSAQTFGNLGASLGPLFIDIIRGMQGNRGSGSGSSGGTDKNGNPR